MADNSQVTAGTGDTIRDLARQAGNVKTQVVQLDLGGATANAEILITAGQQVMAVSVPVVIASDQPAFATLAARDTWGQALAAVSASTTTIASLTAAAGYRVKGMVCHGTGDGYFAIKVAGLTVLSGRTRSTSPMLMVSLPNGISVTTGAAVALSVTNESGSTADYEATLLGE